MPRNRLRARNARRWVGRLEVVGMGATLLQTAATGTKKPPLPRGQVLGGTAFLGRGGRH